MSMDALRRLSHTLGKIERHWWLMLLVSTLLSGAALSREWSWRTAVPIFLFFSICYQTIRSVREKGSHAGKTQGDTDTDQPSSRSG